MHGENVSAPTSAFAFPYIVLLDEIADEELALHAEHIRHTGMNLDVKAFERERLAVCES